MKVWIFKNEIYFYLFVCMYECLYVYTQSVWGGVHRNLKSVSVPLQLQL